MLSDLSSHRPDRGSPPPACRTQSLAPGRRACGRPSRRRPTGLRGPSPTSLLPLAIVLGISLARSARTDTIPPSPPFMRGDSNLDGHLDLTDPLGLLFHVFAGAGRPRCLDAADFDDDGHLSLTDSVVELEYLFLNGPPPAAPFPGTGQDPTRDTLGCDPDPVPPGIPFVDDGLPAGLHDLDRLASEPRRVLGRQALLVSESLFEAVTDLEPGLSVLALDQRPGGRELLGALSFPEPGAPVVLGSPLTVPTPPGGCWRVDARRLAERSFDPDLALGRFLRGDVNGDGQLDADDVSAFEGCLSDSGQVRPACPGSCPDAWDVDDNGELNREDHDLLYDGIIERGLPEFPAPNLETGCGPDPTPDPLESCDSGLCASRQDTLVFEASPPVVCGSGTHDVEVTVRDEDGQESTSIVRVTLCDPESLACQRDSAAEGARTPESPPELEVGLKCFWLVAAVWMNAGVEREVDQKSFWPNGALKERRRSLPVDPLAPMYLELSTNGPGALHHIFMQRANATCHLPVDTMERLLGGFFELRITVLCLDEAGHVVDPPCASRVASESAYISDLEVRSVEGRLCEGLIPRVETFVQDETRFTMGEDIVFAKGVTMRNGTTLSERPSWELAVGGTTDSSGKVSSRFDVSRGRSQVVEDRTGSLRGELRALGGGEAGVPVRLTLDSRGHARILGQYRSTAYSRVTSQAAGIWVAALSDCPGARPLGLTILDGRAGALEELTLRSRAFLATRLAGRGF